MSMDDLFDSRTLAILRAICDDQPMPAEFGEAITIRRPDRYHQQWVAFGAEMKLDPCPPSAEPGWLKMRQRNSND